jgi:hypothetical protein
MVRKPVVCIALAGLLAGCGGLGTSSTPPPVVVVVQHLYVGNNNTPGTVQAYTLPITSTSTPAFSFASNNVVSIGFDANSNALVGDNAGHLQYFTAPLSATSTPAVTFSNGSNNGQITFNIGGQAFVANASTAVNLFTPPFTNSSAPSTVVSGGLVSAIGDVLDNLGDLYVANSGVGGGTGSNLEVFVPPYTGAPSVTTPTQAATAYRKMAGSGSTLYVCSVAGTTGRIDAYGLPLTNTSVPAFAITTGVNVPEAIAFDQNGNMYVGNLGNSTITVYAPPFTATSAPAVTLTIPGTFAIFGIAIGR